MSGTNVTALAIDLIRTDGGTQSRVELNNDVIDDYCELWLSGAKFNPIDVYHDGADYWPSDGFHRLFSAIKAKRASINAIVRRGTKEDAWLAARGANQDHGLRRTNADKRKCVTDLLNHSEYVKWSDNKVAEFVGVSQRFVSDVRSELRTVLNSPVAKAASEPRVGKDGKSYKPRKPKPPPKVTATDADDSPQTAPVSPSPPRKANREVSTAKMVDELTRQYVSPLVRGIDSVADANGGKGDHHAVASASLDTLIAELRHMREGKR